MQWVLYHCLTASKTSASEVQHAAYADDLSGAGKLKNLRKRWDNVTEIGPFLGYFPRPDKSWLIVKPELFQSAVTAFADTDLQITIDGHSYLGGYIGTSTSKEEHITTKVRKLVEQIDKLSSIAKYEPQAAYADCVSGFSHKFTYSIRTTPNIPNLLRPLDHVIDTKLIPALTDNQTISRNERLLLALPVRLGGLGIDIVADISSTEFENSKLIFSSLTREIVQQNNEHSTEIHTPEAHLRIRIIKKSDRQKQQLQQIRESISHEQLRANDLAQLKCAPSWLTALPLKSESYNLAKREFLDALALRYRWCLRRLPTDCACGKKFTVDYGLSCCKGGYIHRRHDEARDLFCKITK